MKIFSTTASYYDRREVLNIRGQRYAVYSKNSDDPMKLELQVSEIHPYDDADYAWAKMQSNKQVSFYRNSRLVDKMQLSYFDEYFDDSAEDYYHSLIDDICFELRDMNKGVEPVMVHN